MTEIALRQHLDIEQIKFIANSNFVPTHYRGKLPEIMACLATGREMGMGDMESLRMIHVIDGKPAMAAELMVKRARQAGHSIKFEQGDGWASAIGTRGDNGDTFTAKWTLERAKQMGLLSKQNYQKQPQTMLLWRSASEVCRFLFPDVLGPVIYTPDEAELTDEEWIQETLSDVKPPADSGPDDLIEDGVLDYSGYRVEGTVYDGQTIAEVAADPNGLKWLKVKLKSLPDESELRAALEAYVEAELPDVYAAYLEWKAAQ